MKEQYQSKPKCHASSLESKQKPTRNPHQTTKQANKPKQHSQQHKNVSSASNTNVPSYTPRLSKRRIQSNDTFNMSQQSMSNVESSSNFMSVSLDVAESPVKKDTDKVRNYDEGHQRGTKQKKRCEQRKEEYQQVRNDEGGNIMRQNQDDNLFGEKRKSYRKTRVHRKTISSVPFRKCQTFMEERIVSIINKLDKEKQCERQLKGLIERMKKLSSKEIMNRYIISGICIICRILQTNDRFAPYISEQLQQSLNAILEKITEEMDNFQTIVQHKQQQQKTEIEPSKVLLIRKAYRLLKKKNKGEKEQKRKKATKLTEELMQNRMFTKEEFLDGLRQLI